MPSSPQLRFLLRATGLLLVALFAWWIFLLDPLLAWTRATGSIALDLLPGSASGDHVTVKPDGNWLLQLPVPTEALSRPDLRQLAGSGGSRGVRSFKMEVSRGQVALYTVAVPIFLALMFSVIMPFKEMLRALGTGCGILLLLMPVALTLWGLSTIRAYFHIASSPGVQFLWSSAGYLNSEVLPYLVPLFLAVWLNRALRTQIFSLVPAGPPAPASPAVRRDKKKRRRGAPSAS